MSYLVGIDVSEHNSGDYSPLSNLNFVIARCSIGNTKDARWDQHSAYVIAHPPCRLFAYHFADRHVDPIAQAKFALSVVGSKAHTLFLDREGSDDVSDQMASQIYAVWRNAGKIAGQYHSESGYPKSLGQSVNWVADWSGKPSIGIPYDFWQYTGGPLDHDYYLGDQANLDSLAGVVKPSTNIYILSVKNHATPYYTAANGHAIGYVYTVSFKVQRYMISGHWWYRVISSRLAKYKNTWIPAMPWETVTLV